MYNSVETHQMSDSTDLFRGTIMFDYGSSIERNRTHWKFFESSITELMIMKASSLYFILAGSCPDDPANI